MKWFKSKTIINGITTDGYDIKIKFKGNINLSGINLYKYILQKTGHKLRIIKSINGKEI